MIFIREKFKTTGQGIVALLQHKENGLARGTVLVSETTQKSWSIETRVKYDYAIDVHKEFKNETLSYVLITFQGRDKKEKAISSIKQEEDKNVYHYMIKPIGHDDIPEYNEALSIIVTDMR